MKKFLLLLFVLLFVASTASAATKAKKAKKVVKKTVVVEEGVPGHFFLQAQGGPGFILSDLGIASEENADPTVASPGWGYNLEAGYAFTDVVSLSLLYGYQVWAYSYDDPEDNYGASMAYIPIQLVGKFTIPGDQVRFYGFLGAGLAFNCESNTATYPDEPVDGVTRVEHYSGDFVSFLLSPGVGLELSVSDKVNLFFQTKLEMNFFNQDLADLAEGPEHKFTVPMLVMPLQVGMNFSL